jgi:hypothetical protein
MKAFPKLAPLTLSVTDPVLATLLLNTLDTDAPSYVYTSDSVPARAPLVIEISTLPLTPDPTRQTTSLSDTHTLASQADDPARPAMLMPAPPKPLPNTVTLADPVPARFVGMLTLTTGMSYDTPKLKLPARTPAVTTTTWLCLTPLGPLQSTELSDTHTEASHPLEPTRPAILMKAFPKLAPLTLSVIDPVLATLLLNTLDTMLSYEKASVTDAGRPPVVTTIVLLPETPSEALQVTKLSDAQFVASQPLTPARALTLAADIPKFDPLTVTDANWVLEKFRIPTDDTDTSNEKDSDNDPACVAIVSVNRRVPPIP